jgi:DNA-binding LacI/PurR family transcriptional regulator
MAATIVDVARRAGVSIATVSRSVHGSSLVNLATRRRVEQAMTELNYAPNVVARGLVTSRTQAIGLVITSMADPFFPPIVQGVEETAHDHGYGVLLCTSNNDPLRELSVVRLLRERRVDAIIIAASRVGGLYRSHLQETKAPLVLINNEQSGTYDHSVGTDDVAGGRLATEHLIDLGHRTIGYVHGPLAKASTQDRLRGYEMALCAHGWALDPALVVVGDGQAEGGRLVVRELLMHSPRPTAVVCFNDLTALGVLFAIRNAGLRVPQDISVIGYDDIALAAYTEPPLTTIAQQSHEMGSLAMRLALDLLAGKEVASVTLPAALVQRESCGPPR